MRATAQDLSCRADAGERALRVIAASGVNVRLVDQHGEDGGLAVPQSDGVPVIVGDVASAHQSHHSTNLSALPADL
jgi:hypothetical protein